MDETQFYIVIYHGSTGRFTAECVQLSQINVGKTIDEAIDRCLQCSRSRLHGAAGGEYQVLFALSAVETGLRREYPHSPFSPSEERIWELINPAEMNPIRKYEYDIDGKYRAVFLCFDRTDAENPHDIG